MTRLEKSRSFWFLLFLSFLFFVFRLPSLFEPYWYGDEGIYHVIGQVLRDGGQLYRDAWDNKPPFLYLIYAAFNSSQFYIRLVSLGFGILSIALFFLLSQRLFAKVKISYITTSLYTVLFGLPLIEGNIANAENFMHLPIIAAAYFVTFLRNPRVNFKKLSFLAGLTISFAFLFKIVAVFDFLAFLSFLFIINYDKGNGLYRAVKKTFYFVAGFVSPILIVTLFFAVTGDFRDYLNASFFSNVSYVGYANKFLIPQGLLIFKAALLALAIFVLFLKRKGLEKTTLFIVAWFLFSLFDAFFSQRPYVHYLLMLLPSFCLMIGLILWEQNKRAVLVLFVLSLIAINFAFPGTYYRYKKILPYYKNFISFVAEKKSLWEYQKFFDGRTPVDYELARYVRMNTSENDNIFIWGNNAQVYTLSNKTPPGRYSVAYHITAYKNGVAETMAALEKKKPKLIIVMPNVDTIPFTLVNYEEKMTLKDIMIYERVL